MYLSPGQLPHKPEQKEVFLLSAISGDEVCNKAQPLTARELSKVVIPIGLVDKGGWRIHVFLTKSFCSFLGVHCKLPLFTCGRDGDQA